MPKKLDADLDALKKKLVAMGEVAQEMFQLAMKALVDREREHIEKIEDMEHRVDSYQIEIDDDVVRMMAVHGPVAMNLRTLTRSAKTPFVSFPNA